MYTWKSRTAPRPMRIAASGLKEPASEVNTPRLASRRLSPSHRGTADLGPRRDLAGRALLHRRDLEDLDARHDLHGFRVLPHDVVGPDVQEVLALARESV